MTAPFLFIPLFRAFDTAGNPLAGGQLFTYAAGTTTPQATYSDAAGTVQNANPVVLDTTGSATVRLGSSPYKFVLKDANGTTQWTEDNYYGISGDSPSFASLTVTGSTSLQATTATTVTATSVVTPGVPVSAIKSGDLSRASTQTFANDPDLTLTLSTGTYLVEAMLEFGCTTTSTQGFKAQLSGTATASGTGAVIQYGNGTFSGGAVVNTYNNQLYGANADLTGTKDYIRFRGTLIVTVAGTLVVQWAQNSATNQTNNTTLFAGSYLRAEKMV